ncbi:hypothetical protein DFH06DRAFT_1481835 [Mycena polygramma]|nr:hypothetical protein DFH06DRAFT_1481835 [Mycena polygramma]
MARSSTEPKKPKMFQLYVEKLVPEVMPFPDLAFVTTTRAQEIAVPTLNSYQRSWIHDVALQGVDLVNMDRKAASQFYADVKLDAFGAKAFQHKEQPQDRVEEAKLTELVAAWKRKHPGKKGATASAGDDGDDEDEDEGSRVGILRGYSRAAWGKAIQKVLSNKRTADKNKLKHTEVKPKHKEDTSDGDSISASSAFAKIFNITSLTGRDKFGLDRHDYIHEYSKTLPGSANAGGKFRKAEAMLWAQEDQASWDAAAADEKDVDWAERQKLVGGSFKHMVDTLHASLKFRPFVALMLMGFIGEDGRIHFQWDEGVPDDIGIDEKFEDEHPKLVKEMVDRMHEWAVKPLTAFSATRTNAAIPLPPVFPLSAEAIDETAPKVLAQTVASFLQSSYQSVFGSEDIPWAAIARDPAEYFDIEHFEIRFTETGFSELTRADWDKLATALVAGAGPGTAGFFRKPISPPPRPETPPPPPIDNPQAPPSPHSQQEEDEAARKKREEAVAVEEVARLQRDEEAARVLRDEEAARVLQDEEAARVLRDKKAARVLQDEEAARVLQDEEAARVLRDEEAARVLRDEEAARVLRDEEAARVLRDEENMQQDKDNGKKTRGGRKRKAEEQLVPEEVATTGRPSRVRKKPEDAQREHREKVLAEIRAAGKPRWNYELVPPPKAPETKAPGGSKRSRS